MFLSALDRADILPLYGNSKSNSSGSCSVIRSFLPSLNVRTSGSAGFLLILE